MDLLGCLNSTSDWFFRAPAHCCLILIQHRTFRRLCCNASVEYAVFCVVFVIAFLQLRVRCGKFSAADHDVSVPCRSAFEQDVEHGNTDGLGDCQSKQALFTLIFPPLFHTPATILSPAPLSPPFLSSLPSPFSLPSVCPYNPLFQPIPSICSFLCSCLLSVLLLAASL